MSGLNFSYQIAQRALADLKTAVFMLLQGQETGLTNAQIARGLGMYYVRNTKQDGAVSRVLLEIMQVEGVVELDTASKKWRIKK